MSAPRVVIVGGGAWGTALAAVAVRAGASTSVLTRRAPEEWLQSAAPTLASVRAEGLSVAAVSDPQRAKSADLYVIAVKAQELRETLVRLSDLWRADAPIVVCCKGVENTTALLMHEVAAECAPHAPCAVLSGPNFAAEVARGLPAACVLAAESEGVANDCADMITSPNFRVYRSVDRIGVEIGGALKNIVAVACGMASGKKLGENAVAALVTRALAEISRLALAAGAHPETLYGLSGLGDMLLTCTSKTSRNFSYGARLAAGEKQPENATAEGVASAKSVLALAKRFGAEDMPICFAVHRILYEGASVDDEIAGLLGRPAKTEA
ncbi:MAG: NAD(P)H-dependent glycerol-3-phosphate dehydrogenase [Rickettsiales bacterium]